MTKMKAELHSYNLDINFRCPNCRLFFRLSNRQIPTEKSTKVCCENCNEKLVIDPFKITKPKKKRNARYQEALSIMVRYGWSNLEARTILDRIADRNPDVDLSVLLKLAFVEAGSDEFAS